MFNKKKKTNLNHYQVLLFDLDGTLCDTDEMIVQSFFSLYKEFAPIKVRTREEIYYFSGPPIKETLKNEFPKYDPLVVYQAFQRISKEFYEPYVTPYKDEICILKKLKEAGYLLGVVTNKGKPLTYYSLEICKIKDLFDVIISADDVLIPKPDPSGINRALELLNITDKKRVLYIGDNDIDYFTAENAQVDSLLAAWGPREIKCIDKAKYHAASYNEIGEILL